MTRDHQRVLARAVLALIGAAVVLLFATPPSRGSGVVRAQPSGSATGSSSPSASESPSEQPSATPTGPVEPTGPSVALLNPNPAYDPLEGNHQVGSEDIPQISTKLDADENYHVVAHTAKVPQDATGVAVWASDGGGETTIGDLERTEGARNVWEAFWKVPENLDGDTGKVFVRIYDGAKKIAEHSVEAEIDLAEESVELTWPTNGGQLGFFKSSAGPWRTVVDGIRSANTRNIYLLFSTSPRGTNPTFEQCATVATANATAPQPWQLTCPLPVNTLPSQVTAIAAVAGETDNPVQTGGGGFVTQEGADVHGVRTYLQDPATMQVDITGVAPTAPDEMYPTSTRRVAGEGCIEYDMLVTDHLDRPVQGANVDVHVQGPDDEAGTGIEASTSTGSSPRRAPEEGGHVPGDAWDCDSPGDHGGAEGRHEDPDGNDVKHIESTVGSGLGLTGISPGVFRFHVFSPNPGDTRITGWVDEELLKKEAGIRKPNGDTKETGEASAKARAQFLQQAVTVEFRPPGDSAGVGTCHPWRIRVRGGTSLLDGVNVDIHASGPTNDLDFCDPVGGNATTAPDMPETGADKHTPEERDEATHPSTDPDEPNIQHSEGTTDEQGDLVIGLNSPLGGDTTVTAWLDGDPEANNDVQATGEVSGLATLNWVASAADAEVRFVNPSGYGDGGGDTVSSLPDANGFFHVVTRVDAPTLIQGVELLISSDGQSFSRLGTATRISNSDTWAYNWDTARTDDGSYTLRARVIGTDQVEDREISLDNAAETAHIASPGDASQAIFLNSKTSISGTASSGAAGVDLYYTLSAANQARNADQWKACGTVELAGADDPQPFSGECTLDPGDAPNEVTGVAALAFLCDFAGCEAPLGAKLPQSGDARRVFGSVGDPVLSLDVGDGNGDANTCQRIVVQASDQSGAPIGGANIDIHLRGPSNDVEFCEFENSNNRSPDQGGHSSGSGDPNEGFHTDTGVRHTEGETGTGGRFVIGIRSSDTGTSDIDAWLDSDDDDVRDNDETVVDGGFDWGRPRGCTEVGTAGDDVLVGGPGVDRICGKGGDDVIVGKGGSDILIGGGGNDVLRGSAGRDAIRGTKGRDTLFGGKGPDRLNGGAGRDRCKGGAGRDKTTKCER